MSDVVLGSRSIANTQRTVCPHGAYVLVGKTDKINKKYVK